MTSTHPLPSFMFTAVLPAPSIIDRVKGAILGFRIGCEGLQVAHDRQAPRPPLAASAAKRDKACLEPAASVIAKVGGVKAATKITGKNISRVYRWMQPKASGGTDGAVPYEDAQKLLKHASATGIDLTPDDFFECGDTKITPTADDIRKALLTRAAEFSTLTGKGFSRISEEAMKDSKFLSDIQKGRNFTVSTYQRVIDWIDAAEIAFKAERAEQVA